MLLTATLLGLGVCLVFGGLVWSLAIYAETGGDTHGVLGPLLAACGVAVIFYAGSL